MLMLITYYVCIYIIKRVIKYMGTARYSHDSVKLEQLSRLWSGETLLTLFFSMVLLQTCEKRLHAGEREKKERVHCIAREAEVGCYITLTVYLLTKRSVPSNMWVSMSLIGSREYALSSFILLYVFFFWGFIFLYQISTARGMNVGDNEREMRVTRVIRKMSIVGNM